MFESTQAIVAFVVMLLTLIIELVIAVLNSGTMGLAYWAVSLVFAIPLTILFVYAINCMVMGSCHVLSWFNVLFFALEFIFMVVLMIFTIIATKKKSTTPAPLATTSIAAPVPST